MPFTLFKFPTLFGRKQSTYKLHGRAGLPPLPLDIENKVDPVIISHGKPSFTTFGYNSEYALEDILRSGVYDVEADMEDVEKAIAKRGAKRRRAKLPVYKVEEPEVVQEQEQVPEEIENNEEADAVADLEKTMAERAGSEEEVEADTEFQQLYEELQGSTALAFQESGPLTYQFEKIYEDLALGVAGGSPAPASYLPPEIYRLHTEGHSQRMGILTKYVDTSRSYSSLASLPPEEEPAYALWSPGEPSWSAAAPAGQAAWCARSPQTFWPSDRLDFIPARETVVDTEELDREEEPIYQVPRSITLPVLLGRQEEEEKGEEEDEEEEARGDDEGDGEMEKRVREESEEEGTDWESFISCQERLHQGGPGSGGMESDCESVDSGLEESGHSNLDLDGGFTVPEEEDDLPESIYENAAVLKSNNSYLTPVTAAIEKYQFGGQGVEEDDGDEVVEDEKEEVASEEEEEEEEEEKAGVVTYPPLDMDAKREPERGSKLWGVRHGGSVGLTPISRSANPTEDKIAKEIRELKEREEELVRRRESKSPSPVTPSPSPPPPVKEEPKSEAAVKKQQELLVKKQPSPEKFNPHHYRPLLPPGTPRPRIMEDFISNGGRVTAFVTPDHTKELVTLRKPTVHKSVPKVQAPTALTRQPAVTTLDKIQAELAETRRREEELRRARRQMSRSTPDLTKVLPTGPERTFEHSADSQSEGEEDAPSSMLQTRGKSALISVWESRIQGEQAA